MPTTISESTYLEPGQYVDLVFEIFQPVTLADETAAVKYIKAKVAKDKRWHYMGGDIQQRTIEATGRTFRALVITVQIADPAKRWHNPPTQAEIQEANTLGVVIRTAGAVVTAAVAVYVIAEEWRLDRQAERVLQYNWAEEHPVAGALTMISSRTLIAAAVVLVVWLVFRGR